VKAARVEVEVAVKEGTVWGVEDGIRADVHGYERRQWRHLDTMQCETVVVAEVPRLKWKGKNGKEQTEMVTVPWARKSSRWTVWFEAWAGQVLQAAAGLEAEDLPKRAGSDPIKSVLAEIVWSRTSVNMEWIAQALNRRIAGNVRQQIHRRKAGKIPPRDKKAEKLWTKEFIKRRKQSQITA
jgi:hypothetical protein